MKYYLAHPLALRKEIRETELFIEKSTGVELINPFYDTGRDDIELIDKGERDRASLAYDPATIVGKDLGQIMISDGVVAYLTKETHQVGTICEIWFCANQAHKPVYIVSDDCLGHPWIRFIIQTSGGQGFTGWDKLVEWLKGRVKKT